MKKNDTTTPGVKGAAVRFLHSKETPVFLILIVLCIALGCMSPYFFTMSNLMTTLVGLSCDGIIAIGMTIVLAMGGIDLSVGSVMGLSAMATAKISQITGNIWLGALIGIVIAGVCGLINGFFIAKVHLTPFIMTLAMMSIASGSTLIISSGKSLSISRSDAAFMFIGQGYIGNVFPFLVALFIVFAIVFSFLLQKTELFRKVYYIGSNEKAAKLSGINVGNMKVGVYFLSALLSGVCGVLSVSRFASSTTSTGSGAEMTAISAAVIGGASLAGGEGSVFGAVLGILLLKVVGNGLILLNVSVYGQDLVSGLILLGAVTLDILSHKKEK